VTPLSVTYSAGLLFSSYELDSAYDEMFQADGGARPHCLTLLEDLVAIGIDPTNNIIAGERHIRIAFGRDDADVPPTRGVYKGLTAVRSELAVSVRMGPVHQDIGGEPLPFLPWMSRDATSLVTDADRSQEQQQQ
jgi:hypothetical protein